MPAPFNVWVSLDDEEPGRGEKNIVYVRLEEENGKLTIYFPYPQRVMGDTHWMKLRPPTRQELADEQVRQSVRRHQRNAGLRTDTAEGKNQT